MKRKINLYLIGMSVAVVIVTALSVTFVCYGLFQKQVRSDLRTSAELLSATGVFQSGQEKGESQQRIYEWLQNQPSDTEDLRVTWIAGDGTVLYDNDAEASLLENHSDRPEFEEALENGEGETRRRSDTMGQNTFYYALLLEDGSVLRLATDVSGIFNVFIRVLPLILLIVAVIILASALIAHLLTRQLLSPIEKMAQNMENTSDVPAYEELVPFVNTIRAQHENVLAAARSRQDFTANVSHELKTPLTAISGYAELIENHMVDPEEESRCAGKIRQNADRLLSLINDIIRLSELDSGEKGQLVFEEMDLYALAQSRVEGLSVSADRKKVHLSLEGEPCPMRGNSHMIAELIDNICQNAIQYNKENGEVSVQVRKEEGRPVLTVEDTGIGIPKNLQERVFERFFRVDKSRSRETGGTGLGLAIVKHIAELQEAEISLESSPGVGTKIQVRF